ncbi:MAG: hypothetical protein KAG19_05140 [Methylococcales bacterium]|nr:hypothetical protein [Methylococcales bacterium]
MELSLQNRSSLFSWVKTSFTLKRSALQGHNQEAKQDALYAITVLQKYKKDVHEFTDEIVDSWALARKVMDRYYLDDAEQLNEWLDDIS